eukprot:GEMP01058112.1.p1 GENE.GEMP01058112.1~~GEMP01058112.1.p1  ORF type:complete len:466 (+),score=89.36 GEMP01058112.1:19-1416(+)
MPHIPPPSWVQRGYSVVRQLQSTPTIVYIVRHDATLPTTTTSESSVTASSTATTSASVDTPQSRRSAATTGSGDDFVAKIVQLQHLNPKDRLNAQQELSVLKSLHHPNVVAYRDSWEDHNANSFVTGPHLVLVMELALDGDLRRPKEEAIGGGLTGVDSETVIFWARQMLLGLQYIHQVRLVHRDLKSANVFLTDTRSRCLVGDFGISKVLESTLFANTCVGTPAYMAPEIVRNEKYASSVDMWAFGVILYELLTLQLPFSSASLLGLVYQICTQDPDFSKLAGVDPTLVSVVKDCLRKPAASRPSANMLVTQCPLFMEKGLPAIPTLPSALERSQAPRRASFGPSLPRPKGASTSALPLRTGLPPLSFARSTGPAKAELGQSRGNMGVEISGDGPSIDEEQDERLRKALQRAREQRTQLSKEDLDRLLDPVIKPSGAVCQAAAIEAKVNIFMQRRLSQRDSAKK